MTCKYGPSFLLLGKHLETLAEGLQLLDVFTQRLVAGADILHKTADAVESGGLVLEGVNLVLFGV